MELNYTDTLSSERSVEIPFTCEMINKYGKNKSILDVGGVPSSIEIYSPIWSTIEEANAYYDICDFRGGKYRGDFVTLDIKEKFDIIMFISSLEHFPQCTEGDLIYREGEDRKGFLKALSLLNPGGKIILTVPFGMNRWQPYRQNYDINGILKLTEGSKIIDSFTYKLIKDKWILTDPANMKNILYISKANGVGCFVLEKT